MLEVVCAIAIIALLVAIAMPRVPRATSRAQLEAYAVELASLLKSDRNASVHGRGSVAAEINAPARLVRSGAGSAAVSIPQDVQFEALLPTSCNGRAARSTIRFFANGMSCGGVLRVSRLGSSFEVRVNWLTGGIEIVGHNAL